MSLICGRLYTRVDNETIEPPNQLILYVVLVQSWCNWDGKDGLYALNRQFLVNSNERMDGFIPTERMFIFPVQFEVRLLID